MGSISCYIAPLVITSRRGGHTDTDTHIHTLRGQDQFLETMCTPGLKIQCLFEWVNLHNYSCNIYKFAYCCPLL